MPFFYCPLHKQPGVSTLGRGRSGSPHLDGVSTFAGFLTKRVCLETLLITSGGDKAGVLLPLLLSWLLDDNYFLEERRRARGQIKAFPTPSANHDLLAPCCFLCWRNPKLPIKISHSQSGLFASPTPGFLFKTRVFACSGAVCACEFTVRLL